MKDTAEEELRVSDPLPVTNAFPLTVVKLAELKSIAPLLTVIELTLKLPWGNNTSRKI